MDKLRATMASIVKYTMDHVFPAEKKRWLEELPHMLGGRSSAEAASAATRRLELGLEKPGLAVEEIRTTEFGEKIRKMLFVLYADVTDMGDLYLWLSHTNTMALETKAEYVLYYKGHADRRLEYILKMYPWIRIVATEATKEDVLVTLETMFKEIKSSLAGGENLYIRGFGSFIIKKRAAKIGRNIKKNVSVSIPEHFIPAFKPAKEFVHEIKSSPNIKEVPELKEDNED
jgi:DNA-binding protein HU-beta